MILFEVGTVRDNVAVSRLLKDREDLENIVGLVFHYMAHEPLVIASINLLDRSMVLARR